jgi:cytochrome c oxidase subunit 2
MRRAAAVCLLFPAAACTYQQYQSPFGGAGVDDRQFLNLFAIFATVCALMYLVVIAFLITATVRRRRAADANVVENARHHRSSPAMRTALIGWGAVVAIGLVGLAVASFFTDRSLAAAASAPKLSVTVTGNQWWWDIQYNSNDPSRTLRTANELHLPVGVPTRIILRSNDVIHSFWVPSLAGKQDLIPGREADITIAPTRQGIFRGQCAEFCGTQHAHMAFVVNVDSRADFAAWWSRQLQPAQPPRTQLAAAGYNYFTQHECSMCHTISGTPAGGAVGPDLTHLASRRTLAAGTLPMNRGNLYGWIADPQSLKPGSKMPTTGLGPAELHALVAYLETLK